jgi:DNA-binding PadR family transcriptional regulator
MDLEYDILVAVVEITAAHEDAYGFGIARTLAGSESTDALVGHGTLYKALARLVDRGLLTAQWEETPPDDSPVRPRRRLYAVTGEGSRVLGARPMAVATRRARPALA